jgi:sec-independent protein translocase protein TatB
VSGIGSSELLLILLIAAIVIGPQNVQPLIKAIIKAIRAFKKYMEEMKSELDISEDINHVKQEINGAAAELSLKNELDEIEEVMSEIPVLRKDIHINGQARAKK